MTLTILVLNCHVSQKLAFQQSTAFLCRMLRAHGWTRDLHKPKVFEEEYDFRLMGYNVRPVEMHAAVAREQLRKLARFRDARLNNRERFYKLADRLLAKEAIVMQQGHGRIQSPFGIAFEVNGGGPEGRRRLVAALREAGIDCRLPTGGSLRCHPYGARWASQETPRADRIHRTGMFLGNAPFPITELLEETVEIMEKVLL